MNITLFKREDFDGTWYVVEFGLTKSFFRQLDEAQATYEKWVKTATSKPVDTIIDQCKID